ncbi:pyrroline-5-carboxylate reductase [Halalkalibacterium halodurans]|uniref:pyrroline-5-carboxylate reductase n=1 Tax=Halalkalibacterium halodurans TaxID=86665 RepID=UPI002E2483A3|nr:pyrroline-5-carboxylate reductase [Halalkalibacterium halodurans]MED4082913.1 pyrroline-5-carboxylate reductase [Halalkalibacterium halodurans]MED4084799.1 pyrroline-5-carboxylate reductase [Halalkalibacterium halodurans]MED4106093.1 pyrroline-5-carboxylate reductase [Halalkalibacterium halodurans]MED4110714.1 pyrroline-5-carboxylate reductase [Halalkalibacterium halodurans]MED4125247.1 pyrroline-5-carboxylate reductase [Halalkalibacterium halodurans]
MLQDHKITFLGAGSMAESIIAGLLSKKLLLPSQVIATNLCDETKLTKLEDRYGICTTQNRQEAVRQGTIIFLAMKPKNIEEAIEEIRGEITEKQLFISVLAGTTTSYIETLLAHEVPVVRTMPNTSAKVGASATGLCGGRYANASHVKLATLIFTAIGTVTEVTEDKLDAVTGLAGSGPAYFYYMVEAMERAAVQSGLTESEAKAFISQTLIGTGKRLEQTSKTAEELYKEVMSPGGTTEAGLRVLEQQQMQQAIEEAITAAINRSRELGSTPSLEIKK